MNRKGYFSVLLQGICDDRGKFIDVFAASVMIGGNLLMFSQVHLAVFMIRAC